jgi:hypothetical protein
MNLGMSVVYSSFRFTPAGNWRWRCTEDMLSPAILQWLYDLTTTSDRALFDSQRIPPTTKVMQ